MIRSAAEAGDSDAMVELGRLYRSGLGVSVDQVQAYVWFNRAAAAMNMDGVYERDNIALKLSPDEMKSAQALSLADEEDHAPRPRASLPATTERPRRIRPTTPAAIPGTPGCASGGHRQSSPHSVSCVPNRDDETERA